VRSWPEALPTNSPSNLKKENDGGLGPPLPLMSGVDERLVASALPMQCHGGSATMYAHGNGQGKVATVAPYTRLSAARAAPLTCPSAGWRKADMPCYHSPSAGHARRATLVGRQLK
jgi:hypothetical protein